MSEQNIRFYPLEDFSSCDIVQADSNNDAFEDQQTKISEPIFHSFSDDEIEKVKESAFNDGFKKAESQYREQLEELQQKNLIEVEAMANALQHFQIETTQAFSALSDNFEKAIFSIFKRYFLSDELVFGRVKGAVAEAIKAASQEHKFTIELSADLYEKYHKKLVDQLKIAIPGYQFQIIAYECEDLLQCRVKFAEGEIRINIDQLEKAFSDVEAELAANDS